MLYEKLPAQDVEAFQAYVRLYAGANGNYPEGDMADPGYILRLWDEAKSQYLWSLFGERFIIEKEVSFDRSLEQTSHYIGKQLFCDLHSSEESAILQLRDKLLTFMEDHFGDFAQERFLIGCLFNANTLASNTISASSLTTHKQIIMLEGNKVVIEPGMKLMRALSKLSRMCGCEELFEKARLEHSMLLNQAKFHGTLCLSIHPMDYITMSDNAHNWSSCMNWQNDGDYRIGTIEMMNSPCVVVAYLKSDNRRFPITANLSWNSKSWRTLVVVHPEVIASVKGYPYAHEKATQSVLQMLKEQAARELNWEFNDDIVTFEDSFITLGERKGIEFSTCRMYNDFGTVQHYAYIAKDFQKYRTIDYSGAAECIWCGDYDPDELYPDNNIVCCCNCLTAESSEYYRCDFCGRFVCEGDTYWLDDGCCACDNCINDVAFYCPLSETYQHNERAVQIFLAETSNEPDPALDRSILVDKSYIQEEPYHQYWLMRRITCPPHCSDDGILFWNREDLTTYGLHLFDIY
jgi:hypothetical protein